jgi:hypothetical protein
MRFGRFLAHTLHNTLHNWLLGNLGWVGSLTGASIAQKLISQQRAEGEGNKN